MSQPSRFYLKPLMLSEAIEKFQLTLKQVPNGQLHVQFATNIPNFTYSEQLVGSIQLDTSQNFRVWREKIETVKSIIECTSFSITLDGGQNSITYRREESSLAAQVEIACNTPDSTFTYIHKLQQIFEFISKTALVATELPKIQKEALEYQQGVMASLRAEVAKISEFNLAQAKTLAQFFTKATIDLDSANAARQQVAESLLEEKRRGLEAEYQIKLAALDKRDEELRVKTAEADARDSMVVRRQLLTNITTLISTEKVFEISESTSKKRNSVRWTIYCSIFGSSIWIAACVARLLLFPDTHNTWANYVPIPFGMVFLVSSIIYLIKWNDQWAREHAHAEMRNKKMNQDILRASWLAEMFFEGKDKERLLPDMLISRFSEGLFVDIEKQTAEHPYDNMVELLKKVSSVKIGKDTLELNKEASKEKS